jgi:glyoxylase-like metal-dependent hydrolase (beta-lactamase superfamily II)
VCSRFGYTRAELARDLAAVFVSGLPGYGPGDLMVAYIDGDEVVVGTHRGRVIHTPGHSPGGVSLFFPDDRILFTGDTLFAGSVGRTDLPGGDAPTLLRSIRERLFPLGDDVRFFPGHGPGGTIGGERKANPYAGEDAPRGRFP